MTVQELLSSPKKWTQGVSARDANGYDTRIDDIAAVCWCLSGALFKCYRPSKVAFYRQRIENIVQQSLTEWNDDSKRTFEDVKSLVTALDI